MSFQAGRVVGACWILVTLLGATAAQAADSTSVVTAPETLPDKFFFRVGYFLIDHRKDEIHLDPRSGPIGTNLDLTRDLDLSKNSDIVRADGYFRFGGRSRIVGTWYKFTRTGTRLSNFEIRYGDTVFADSTNLNTRLEMTLWSLAYAWSFYRGEGAEIYALAGLDLFDLSAEISARRLDLSQDGKGWVPLPTFGLGFSYTFHRRYTFASDFEFFFIQVGDYGGSLSNGEASFEVRVLKNIGAGVAGNVFSFNLDSTAKDLSGSMGVAWTALEFFATLRL